MPWTTSLARPLQPRNHAALDTLADARAYMLELPEDVAVRQVWQHAGKLLLAAADAPEKAAIAGATKQLDLALFLSFRLDMSGI